MCNCLCCLPMIMHKNMFPERSLPQSNFASYCSVLQYVKNRNNRALNASEPYLCGWVGGWFWMYVWREQSSYMNSLIYKYINSYRHQLAQLKKIVLRVDTCLVCVFKYFSRSWCAFSSFACYGSVTSFRAAHTVSEHILSIFFRFSFLFLVF